MLQSGDRATFTADVLWRLYRRKETLPLLTVIHVNAERQSVLVKDVDGRESALSLELLVPTAGSWDSCRRMLRLAETPEALIGFMAWHAAGCSAVEKPTAPAKEEPREKATAPGWGVGRAIFAAGFIALSLACPPLGLVALLVAWSHRDS